MTSIENMWLLILPETSKYKSCAVIAILDKEETFAPPNLNEEKKLESVKCTVSIYRNNGLSENSFYAKDSFCAEYNVGKNTQPAMLDLTNSNFTIKDVQLQGRGLGSWIMYQLIHWAKSLPADTPVKAIIISEKYAPDEINVCRRDKLWHGIGFRFEPVGVRSLPLSIGNLQYPKGSYNPLEAYSLVTGVSKLHQLDVENKIKIISKDKIILARNNTIEDLKKRQWHIVIMNIFLLPVFVIQRMHNVIKRKIKESD